jgi:hypothetical protein
VKLVRHPSEDSLERYSMGTLPGSETGPLEEHLLLCNHCRDRLESTDEYVAAMRAAASELVDVAVNGPDVDGVE